MPEGWGALQQRTREAEGREARCWGEFETPCGVRGRALGKYEYFADLMNHFRL